MGITVGGAALAGAVAARHREINRRLSNVDERELRSPSLLPGWDRLTIVCHLRFGAVATARMTEDAVAGRSTSFYPDGRAVQRQATLEPDRGESHADVVRSLADQSTRLDELWRTLDDRLWRLPVEEPEENPDLGRIDVWTLAILRLTEVEVHGSDLDLDLSPWSTTFVSAALPMRLGWLPTRRANHRSPDRLVAGSWNLVSTDGPSFLVRARGKRVAVDQAEPGADADASIIGTSRELLSFILGRTALDDLETRGDQDLAASFLAAFPPP